MKQINEEDMKQVHALIAKSFPDLISVTIKIDVNQIAVVSASFNWPGHGNNVTLNGADPKQVVFEADIFKPKMR